MVVKRNKRRGGQHSEPPPPRPLSFVLVYIVGLYKESDKEREQKTDLEDGAAAEEDHALACLCVVGDNVWMGGWMVRRMDG